jgi:hypothetical protein
MGYGNSTQDKIKNVFQSRTNDYIDTNAEKLFKSDLFDKLADQSAKLELTKQLVDLEGAKEVMQDYSFEKKAELNKAEVKKLNRNAKFGKHWSDFFFVFYLFRRWGNQIRAFLKELNSDKIEDERLKIKEKNFKILEGILNDTMSDPKKNQNQFNQVQKEDLLNAIKKGDIGFGKNGIEKNNFINGETIDKINDQIQGNKEMQNNFNNFDFLQFMTQSKEMFAKNQEVIAALTLKLQEYENEKQKTMNDSFIEENSLNTTAISERGYGTFFTDAVREKIEGETNKTREEIKNGNKKEIDTNKSVNFNKLKKYQDQAEKQNLTSNDEKVKNANTKKEQGEVGATNNVQNINSNVKNNNNPTQGQVVGGPGK